MTTPSQLRRAAWSLVLLPLLLAAIPAPAQRSPPFALLMHGRIAEALAILNSASPTDGQARLLQCRANLAQDLGDLAVEQCQQAVAALPASAEAQMWFGRALGFKAAHANPVSALSLAKRVHLAFERAVQLDPHDVLAASDLGEFYIGAPGMVGGNIDKAAALANSLLPSAPARAHRLLALIAEKSHSDLVAAEAEYKLAIAAGHTPESYSDLALFYQRHKRYDEAEAAAKQALAVDPAHGP